MPTIRECADPTSGSGSKKRKIAVAVAGTLLLGVPAIEAAAADWTAPPVTVGAGVRTSFTQTDYDGATPDVSDFVVNSARIYLSGKVTENLSLMFNTEYSTASSEIVVMDAAAQFSFSDQVNIWAGRFLPPSDRSNLYGPYYASNWGVYQDGVQDGYPSSSIGRDDGVMWWGQFGIAKLSAGAFDIPSTLGDSDVLYAARAQLDFWDPEGGYYLNGTYYGAKDLLAVGFAYQGAGSDKAYTGDVLLEKKLGGGGVITLEGQYAKYDGLGGYAGPESDGYYGLAAYLFPAPVGIGKFQILAKYGEATYEFTTGDVDQKTTEVDLNYVIKDFNARLSLFFIDKSYDGGSGDNTQIGIGLQVQM